MTVTAVPDTERRAAWLAERRTVITATDVAKILGVSPFGSAIDVYSEKIGIAPEKPPSRAMLRGKRRERLVLDTYAEEESVALEFADPYRLLTHPRLPIGCTLDARRGDDGRPVEAKTARWQTREWGEHGTDEVPMHYATQMAFQMAVLDTDLCDLPVEFSGDEYSCYRLHRDKNTEAGLLEIATDFKRTYIDKRVPPPADGSESYAEFLKAQYPQHVERKVAATAEVQAAAGRLIALKDVLKQTEFDARECEAIIKTFMADAERCDGEGWYTLWRTSKDSVKVDWKAVAHHLCATAGDAEYNLAVEKFTTVTVGARPFLFKVKA